jgi:hypothetical protein
VGWGSEFENEAEDDMDGDLTDSGMGRLLRRKTDIRRLKQMLGDCGGRRVGGEGNVRWVGVGECEAPERRNRGRRGVSVTKKVKDGGGF